MHPNADFRWEDRAALRSFAEQIGFAQIFAETPDGPRVAQLPFVFLDEDRIGFHIARGNGLARHLDGRVALATLLGPDAYVSPDWYQLDDQVPTWNYLALELEGRVTRVDRAALVAQIDQLSAQHEAQLAPKPGWTRAKMDPARFEAMLGAIQGFEMTISAWRGTAKLGQNKPKGARAAVADAFEARGQRAMALLMRDLAS